MQPSKRNFEQIKGKFMHLDFLKQFLHPLLILLGMKKEPDCAEVIARKASMRITAEILSDHDEDLKSSTLRRF
jgi:hypothetical protein